MDRTLAQRIADDLRRAYPPGARTVSAIALRYGVSQTPARQAVRQLIAEGRLERTRGGGLRPIGPTAPHASPPTSPRDWESDLRRDALTRCLRGDTAFWREESLASQLGVGRTALRQVLHRMAGEGFLEHVPRRGWRARSVGAADVADYLRVRERLELLALELAMPRLERGALEAMRDGNADGRLDNRLHDYLIDRSESPLLREIFDRYGVFWSALFDRAAPETRAEEAMAGQHRAILDALLDGDAEGAASALSTHIRTQQALVEGLLATVRTA